jgi:hypothetical protein
MVSRCARPAERAESRGDLSVRARAVLLQWQGQTLTISQSGPTVELNIDKGEFAEGKLTSKITVSAGPPFNSDGLIMPDHSIEWSNGTKWLEQ